MAECVFLLCAMTSIACAVLLLRAYLRLKTRLLLWSSICFIGLAMNNGLLFIDKVIFPDNDLSNIRSVTALLGLSALLFGLIWDSDGERKGN